MNKFKIALIMQGAGGWTGGSEYIKNIILALGSLPDEVRSSLEVNLLTNGQLDDNFLFVVKPYINKIYNLEESLQPNHLINQIRWKLASVVCQQGQARLDEFFKQEKFNFIYPYFAKNNGNLSYNSASWIYDFQHKYYPEFFTDSEVRDRDKNFALMVKYSPYVVLSSKDAEQDFKKYFPQATHKSKILSFKTFPNPQWYESDTLKIQKKYNLPDKFFLISNQFWIHKNHLVVFEALKILQTKNIYPVIVCTGNLYDYRQPGYCNTILQTIHQLGISSQIYILGIIPRFEQIQLMRRCLAIIQPSLFEGWSTVVEDGRCLGKSMIISDLTVNIEQNPPYSLFFPRHSAEELATIMADWWEKLAPGPHLDNEINARENNLLEIEKFGYRFLEIAGYNV